MIGFIDRPMLRLSGRLSEHGATLLSGPHCSSQPETLRWYEFDMTVKCQLRTYMQGPAPFQLYVERKDGEVRKRRGRRDKVKEYLEGLASGVLRIICRKNKVSVIFPDPLIVNKAPTPKHRWVIKRPRVWFSFPPAGLSYLINISRICDGLIIVISSEVSKLQMDVAEVSFTC